jgi:hypothetical protein
MYVNVIQSSDALTDDQNEVQHGDCQCQVKEGPSENENDTVETQNEQQIRDLHYETNTEQTTNVDDVLNVSVTNLHLASGQRNMQASSGGSSISKTKGPRTPNSSIKEYCNFKWKGSPLVENCQPRKFISLAEAVYRFQTDTPDCCHSRPKQDRKRLSLQHRKGITVKSSTNRSPNLRSHLFSHPVHYVTSEEEEEKEKEMEAL